MLLNCDVGEDSREFLGLQGDQIVNPGGNQSWIFIGRTDAEAKAPIHWPPDAKSQLIRKDPDAGKNRRHWKKGMTEDKQTEWHHRLNGHKFGQALGDGEGQEAWRAAVMGLQRARHDWATEPQQQRLFSDCYKPKLHISWDLSLIYITSCQLPELVCLTSPQTLISKTECMISFFCLTNLQKPVVLPSLSFFMIEEGCSNSTLGCYH